MGNVSRQISLDLESLTQAERLWSTMENRARPKLAVDEGDAAHLVGRFIFERAENGMVRAILVNGPDRDTAMHPSNLGACRRCMSRSDHDTAGAESTLGVNIETLAPPRCDPTSRLTPWVGRRDTSEG